MRVTHVHGGAAHLKATGRRPSLAKTVQVYSEQESWGVPDHPSFVEENSNPGEPKDG